MQFPFRKFIGRSVAGGSGYFSFLMICYVCFEAFDESVLLPQITFVIRRVMIRSELMTLGSTQPLREMSTRNLSGGIGQLTSPPPMN
jgi:hypothetical protein